MNMKQVSILPYSDQYADSLLPLIVGFRHELAQLRKTQCEIDVEDAAAELSDYQARNYPVFMAVFEDRVVGYAVVKIDGGILWLESLFVDKACRRLGIASMLYTHVENLGRAMGEPTIYNNVHPNNDAIINFLKKRGCDVLNLIEIRSQYTGEVNDSVIHVGEHRFKY